MKLTNLQTRGDFKNKSGKNPPLVIFSKVHSLTKQILEFKPIHKYRLRSGIITITRKEYKDNALYIDYCLP